MLLVDTDAIDALNAVDEAITVATLPALQAGGRGRDDRHRQDHSLRRAGSGLERGAARGRAAGRRRCASRPTRSSRVGVVSTVLPGLKPSRRRQDARVLGRAARAGRRGDRRRTARCRTTAEAADGELRAAGDGEADLVVVFGASAIADRRDVIPAAIEAAGGTRRAFRHAGRSRQPAAHRRARRQAGDRRAGLRALARRRTASTGCCSGCSPDVPVTRARHRRAGRRRAPDGDRLAAAAARASEPGRTRIRRGRRRRARRRPARTRMGGPNKLLARARRQAAGAPCRRGGARSQARSPVIVVTGHQAERVARGARRARCRLVHNPDLRRGALDLAEGGARRVAGRRRRRAWFCLGDMPRVTAA